VTHLLQVVGLRRDLLGQLHHIALAVGLVKGQKGVAHSSLCEGCAGDR
jgi:hypothetical protein